MTQKGKRAFIPPEAEAIILARALEYPRLKRTSLAEKLQQELGSQKYDVPEIEVLERKISKYRRHSNDSPLEKPWSTATLDSHPIPPQALPIVLKEYRRHIDEGTDFTIRQAKWTARLSATQCSKSLPDLIARTEQIYEMLGQPSDFEIFDKLLAGLPGQVANWRVPFMATASLAGILKNDPIRKEAQNERPHSQEG